MELVADMVHSYRKGTGMKFWDLVEAGMSPMERKVACRILMGMNTMEIAKDIGASYPAVKHACHSLYESFGIPAFMSQRVMLATKLYEYSH